MSELHGKVVLVVFIILCISLLVQSIYYLFLYLKFVLYKPTTSGSSAELPVSVIICARNEVKNLSQFLPSVLEQDYSKYEVIVVNDCSWDESAEYLDGLEKNYKHLKVVTLKEQEKYKHAKKFAVSLGVKAANYDLLLFTDADCKPAGKDWIKNMQQRFNNKVEIVLGYGAYAKQPGLLNKLIRFDTFFIALQYLSCAIVHRPYMGVGRNLAYRKSLFFKSKGFAKHNHLLSGDDDLFVNENANAHNTAIEINPASFTFSKPKETLTQWFNQKKRHFSSGKYYKSRDKLFLNLYWLTAILFYASLVTSGVLGFSLKVLSGALLFRLTLQSIVFLLSMKKLRESDLFLLFPFLEILLIIINPILVLWNLINPKQSWK